MPQTAIFGPFFAMMLLTLLVWVYMYVRRTAFIRSRELRPQDGGRALRLVARRIDSREEEAMTAIRGSCLCRAVRFEITGPTTQIGMCHCSKCRKVSGVASNANLMAGIDRFRWLAGEDRIARFALPDGWGTWRCAVCGSPLPMLHPTGGAYWIPAGLLDDDPRVRIAGHIFVGSKAPWDEIAGEAPRHVEGFGSPRVE